jgi:hypothetical protein
MSYESASARLLRSVTSRSEPVWTPETGWLDTVTPMVFNRGMENICQHCGEEITFTRRPADAGFAAFAHTATKTVACPTDYSGPGNSPEMAERVRYAIARKVREDRSFR